MEINRYFLLLAPVLAATSTFADGGGTARVQVIHNCADAAANSVDVWLDNTLLLDNFDFRTASPFVDAPAGVAFTVGIAPPTSISASESIYSEVFTLTGGQTYVIVASGIVSPTGYTPNPGFSLAVYGQGQETAGNVDNTDVLVLHGSTDAPTVDVFESEVLNTTAVDNASYGDFAGYLNLPTDDYVLQVRDADQTTIVATYAAPLATLGLQGAALTVLASGFLDPGANSNGPAFGLWAALPSGGTLVELPLLPNPIARVQVIHNSADLAASTVDIWLNNTLLLDNFAFRTASPFIDAPATIDFTVGVAGPDSDDPSDALAQFTYNLASGGAYILTANGIVSGSGYTPPSPFGLFARANARETAAASGNTDVLVFHGATDAPTVDVAEISIVNATLVDDLAYSTYSNYLEVPANDYVLQVQLADGTPVVSYLAPLGSLGLANAAITVLASGFLDPSLNSDGASFGLWVALASGGPLVELPLATSMQENSGVINDVSIWPVPATDLVTISIDAALATHVALRITDLSGRVVMEKTDPLLSQGENRFIVPVNSFAAGSYQLTILNGGVLRTMPFHIVR